MLGVRGTAPRPSVSFRGVKVWATILISCSYIPFIPSCFLSAIIASWRRSLKLVLASASGAWQACTFPSDIKETGKLDFANREKQLMSTSNDRGQQNELRIQVGQVTSMRPVSAVGGLICITYAKNSQVVPARRWRQVSSHSCRRINEIALYANILIILGRSTEGKITNWEY